MLKLSESLVYFYTFLIVIQLFTTYCFMKEKDAKYLVFSTFNFMISIYFFWFELVAYDHHSKAAPFGINSTMASYMFLIIGILYLFSLIVEICYYIKNRKRKDMK